MVLQNLQLDDCLYGLQENLDQQDPAGAVFRSYFNIFSYARWKEYTEFTSLYLSVTAEGEGKLKFFDEAGELLRETAVREPDRISMQPVQVRVDLPCDLSCTVLYFLWYPENGRDRVLAASYETEDPPRFPVRLAVDMCTYRRESFVKHNARVLSGIEDVRVYIVDNGNTLSREEFDFAAGNGQEPGPDSLKNGENTASLSLFPNLNSGGSGGFARGMLEIIKDREKYGFTHVILMDDDVSFLPETFVRLKALLSLRTEKYRNACVSGSFLSSELGYIQAEGGAEWPDLRSYPHILNLNLDLREFDTVVRNEKEYHSDHAAWWFACYSLETVREDNLPLPFFIRLDDSEYGIRAGVPVLRLNGICVWHEASENKKDSSLYYYTVRNMLILNAVHGTENSKFALLKFCVRSMLSNLLRYRYKDMELVMKAVEDFLAGPEFFERTDPAAYHQEIRRLGYQLVDVRQLTGEQEALEEVKSFSREKDLQRTQKRSLKHLLTLNGWILPAKWDRLYAFPLSVSQERLYRIGRAVFFDSSNGRGMLARKEFKGLFRFVGNCLRLVWLFRGYGKACEEFYQAREYLTGSEFWRKYLKII